LIACPVDGSALQPRFSQQGFEIKVCPACGGIWLEKDEILCFSESPQNLKGIITQALTSARPSPYKSVHSGEPMAELNLFNGKVFLHYCRQTSGIWIDKDEIGHFPDEMLRRGIDLRPRDTSTPELSPTLSTEPSETAEEISERERGYWGEFGQLFAYPLTGQGPSAVLYETLLFAFLLYPSYVRSHLTDSVCPVGGLPYAVASAGFWLTLPFLVVLALHSFLRLADPYHGNNDDIFSGIGKSESWRGVGLCVVGLALCSLAAIAYAQSSGVDALFWVLIAAAGYLAPMTLVLASAGKTWMGFNAVRLLFVIRDSFWPYTAIYLVWLGSVLLWLLAGAILKFCGLGGLSTVGYVIGCTLMVYLLHVAMRPVQLYIRHFEKLLAVFR
jgi:Zn-finger nucleic acid-binding protein